jgi:ABC-type nitrate/sulfonate/bicarbonate transport system permease component
MAAPTHRVARTTGLLAAQVVAVVAIVTLWQWGSSTGHVDGSFFGTPAGVWHTLTGWAADGTILHQLGSTMALLAVGLGIGTVVGVALGLLIGLSDLARAVLEPFLIFGNGVPRLVLQPFFVVWLGFGFVSRVALVFVVIFVLVAVSVAGALAGLDRDVVVNARLMGAGRAHLVRHVYLPWLAIDLLANSRSNVGFAFQAALVAEFVGGASGLGYLIVKGQNLFDVNSIWAALVIVVVVSIVIDLVIARLQSRASRWRPAIG